MPTRADIRESEEKIEANLPNEAKQARDKRRAMRAKIRAKAKELNEKRPQPTGDQIERTLDDIRSGREKP
jgi:hypothetical protein